ncbi:MAG: flagellar biosynthetic protein FliR [Alphaproteobacteria bacterium]|nr:flagellar biosynthetic protein FliR [Alphaproteobacteria bacterium]
MTTLLSIQIYNFLFVFFRIGSAIMFMPGFMTSYVIERYRLAIALSICLVMTPILQSNLIIPVDNFAEFVKVAMFEIIYGIFIGLFMQFLFYALNLLGTVAGTAVGFANAIFFNPTTQTQSIVIESFFSILAVALVFALDIHHLMISAVIDSYKIFPFGSPLPIADISDFLSQTLSQGFTMGFKISAPFIAFTLVFYSGMGLFSRLMPQLNIFFLSIPLQIYLGLGLLFLTTPVIMMWFLGYFQEGILKFVH